MPFKIQATYYLPLVKVKKNAKYKNFKLIILRKKFLIFFCITCYIMK